MKERRGNVMVRVGLVGVGFIGTVHAESLKNLQDEDLVNFVGVYDTNRNKAVQVSRKWNVRNFESYDDLLKNVDAVILAIPSHVRKDMVLKAIDEGKHVFSEKPLARNLKDGMEIIGRLKDRGDLKFMVGHVLRYFPEYEMIRERILSGDLGRIASVRSFRGSSIPNWSDWFRDFKKSGGVILDLAIHEIDFWLWVLGEIETILARSLSFDEKMEHDYAQIILKFRNGTIAHIEGAWTKAPSYPFRFSEEIVGTRASIHFDSLSSNPIWIYTDDLSIDYPYDPLPYTKMMRDFIFWIEGGEKPRIDPESALKSLDTTLKAVRSAMENEEIKVGGEG